MSSNVLPFSSNINNNALASIFNYTSATYKFYWFLGIIKEIENGNHIIPKQNIFAHMITNSWYPINFFKLSFGSQDKIPEIISYFKYSLLLNDNSDKSDIYRLLTNQDKETRKQLYHLDKNVPHKFLSPWYKGNAKNIREKSQNDKTDAIYRLYKNEIVINDNWYDYITDNVRVLKDFIYWNLALFIQSRNPSTPDIINKLIKPAKRNTLTKQRREFWDIYLKEKPETKCIFTNTIIDIQNYDVDHFVPYSFVSHDLIWNLIPINSSFNRSKNNKVPKIDKYFSSFYKIQIDAINFFGKSMPKKYKEEYLSIFPRFIENQNISYDKYKDVILPLVTVAGNNGFEFLQ
jgi:hypothetical protein